MSRPDLDTFRLRFVLWVQRTWVRIQPAPGLRRWVTLGIVLTVVALLWPGSRMIHLGLGAYVDPVGAMVLYMGVALAAGAVIALVYAMLRHLPGFIGWWGLIAVSGAMAVAMLMDLPPQRAAAIVVGIPLVEGIFLAAWWQILTRRWFSMGRMPFYFTLVAVLATSWVNVFLYGWFTHDGTTEHLTPIPTVDAERMPPVSRMLDPTAPGIYNVQTLFYGSGDDRRRPEFGKGVAIKTESVDGSDFAKRNSWWNQPLRDWYWGFDLKALPRNARVWYPEGDGPYPLVLIVHGNHMMEEYSDGGYEYLGRHFASRGYIVASIDENFLNLSWSGNLKVENDCRGWLLLKHLELWKDWNAEEGNPFFGRVNMDRIALVGHSRGGEAVAIAAAFNRLSAYPDDATIAFDFNFNIRGVVAIAPVDGQYKPSNQPTPLSDVNYLVVHGGHDGDVTQFTGDRQYDRIKFTGDEYHFKSAVYIYRANHGQFNTSWGRADSPWPWSMTLNLAPIMSGEDQRAIALGLFTTFLDATFRYNVNATNVFRDLRVAREWLPKDIYISEFQDSTFVTVADFDEDVDPGTATVAGGRTGATGLTAWKEGEMPLRKSGTKLNKAVFVAWTESDSDGNEVPAYFVTMPPTTAVDANAGAGVALSFGVTQSDDAIPESATGREPRDRHPRLDIEVTDAQGVSVILPIEDYSAIPPILISDVTRTWNEKGRVGKSWEPVLQTIEIPLHDFHVRNRLLDMSAIAKIRFLFDRHEEGYVILDNIGFVARKVM